MESYGQLHANELDNIGEIDKFLERNYYQN